MCVAGYCLKYSFNLISLCESVRKTDLQELLHATICYCMLLYATACYCMIMYATVCYRMLLEDIGRDIRVVTEKSGTMAGSIIEQVSQSECIKS